MTLYVCVYIKAADLVKVNATTLYKWMQRKDVIFLLAQHMPNAKKMVTSFSNTHTTYSTHGHTKCNSMNTVHRTL